MSDLQDFFDKIDWEGGLESAFVFYGLNCPDHPDIQKKIDAYVRAYEELEGILEEYGFNEE